MSDDESVSAAPWAVLAVPAGDARARMAFLSADGDCAAIVTNNDQVSEVGW